jgi:hypothetical protein
MSKGDRLQLPVRDHPADRPCRNTETGRHLCDSQELRQASASGWVGIPVGDCWRVAPTWTLARKLGPSWHGRHIEGGCFALCWPFSGKRFTAAKGSVVRSAISWLSVQYHAPTMVLLPKSGDP